MSIFAEVDTLCQREDNKCKRRNKCWRYTQERRDYTWEANYYYEFGQFCTYFIEAAKTKG